MPDAAQRQLVEVEAVVIRADGQREDLGVIASNDPDGPGSVMVQPDGQIVTPGGVLVRFTPREA